MQTRPAHPLLRLETAVAGLIYVLIILLGAFAEMGVREGVVVTDDPLATARAIMGHEGFYRLGFVAELSVSMLDIPLTLLLYRLLAPAGRSLALLTAIFEMVQTTINAVNSFTQYAPLTLLRITPDLASIALGERADLARLMLAWHDVGFSIALVFFAVACLVRGWLIFRSGFLPKWLGVLLAIAGACYLINSLDTFLALRLPIFPAILLPCLIGESAVALWLLVLGVNQAGWREAAAAEGQSSMA